MYGRETGEFPTKGKGIRQSLFDQPFASRCPSTAFSLRTKPTEMKFKPKNVAYVVWVGRSPGVYHSWIQCKEQTENFPGCRYKGYQSVREANLVWNLGFEEYEKARLWEKKNTVPSAKKPPKPKVPPAIIARAKAIVTTPFGSNTLTCQQPSCSYPACGCGLPQSTVENISVNN